MFEVGVGFEVQFWGWTLKLKLDFKVWSWKIKFEVYSWCLELMCIYCYLKLKVNV